MNKENLKKAALYGPAALLTAFAAAGIDYRLIVRNYTVRSPLIKDPVRIALITDLHSCRYGKNQHVLIENIIEQKPDAVLMSGDIFDHKINPKFTEIFLDEIQNLFPCYMVFGNHECKCGEDDHRRKKEILGRYNVRVLSNEVEKFSVKGTEINICGVDDPTVYTFEPEGDDEKFFEKLKEVKKLSENGNFTVLMSHNPGYFDKYAEIGFDLVLSGHAHGGHWIIPHVLNGVFAPGQGIFPKYAGGEYFRNTTEMIVSRGLARENTFVPRFYNRPELVMIELTE